MKECYHLQQQCIDEDVYEFSDDEADSQTEGEELEKARQIRMQEVKLKPLPYLATDTETEVRIEMLSCRFCLIIFHISEIKSRQ